MTGLNTFPRYLKKRFWFFLYIFLFSGSIATYSQAGVNSGEKVKRFKHDATNSSSLSQHVIINGKKASADTILVKQKDVTVLSSKVKNMILQEGLTISKTYSQVPGLIKLTIQKSNDISISSETIKSKIKELQKSGLFSYVEPDWIVHLMNAPSDSAYIDGQLWGLNNQGQQGGVAGIDINVIEAWGRTTGNPNVIVGVVDSGIRYTHSDLQSNMWMNPNEIPDNGLDDDNNGYIDDVYGINAITGSGDPLDDNDHGTHCAGTIAASGNDTGPIVGVAYTTKLMGLKFLDSSGSGTTSDAVEAINYGITNGANILSNSWGGGGYSSALNDAITAANDAGILFIAAAGNDSRNNDLQETYPAGYEVPNVISVAAIDRLGNLASFSNFGATTVDIGAPGVAIYSSTSYSDESYDSFNGTSMATPHVAGVAALLVSEFPNASISELRARLLNTATPIDSLVGKVVSNGMVNASAALNLEEDGTLEIAIRGASLEAAQEAQIEVSVNDLVPVTNASVSGGFEPNLSTSFLDNGISPDSVAGDGIYTASLTVPSDSETATVSVNVTAPGKQDATASRQFAIVYPPINDNFSDGIQLASGTTFTSGTNIFATSETGEIREPSVAGGKSVWWRWTSPENLQWAIISTSDSDFDTTLAVYTGDSVDALTLIGSNDDYNGLQSSVSFFPTAGVLYHIQVDGYSGAQGNIRLNYPETSHDSEYPAIIRQPLDVTVLTGNSFALNVEATGASELSYQWYKQIDGVFQALPGASSSVYSVSQALEDDESFYYVTVSNSFGVATSQTVFVSVDQVALAPGNDNFIDSQVITGGAGTIYGSNVRATEEVDEPDHANVSSPNSSIWYRWVAPSNGVLSVNTNGSDYDTTLAVYVGSNVGALTVIDYNDDFSGLQSGVEIDVAVGVTYHIAVDGFSTSEGQVILNYSLESDSGPLNDSFYNSYPLPLTGQITGNNINASGELGEPDHASVSTPLASVWWNWVAPVRKGIVTFTTFGSDYDTSIAVYEGDSVDTLTLLASNDDTNGLQSRVAIETIPNKVYSVAVDGYSGSEGSIVLNFDFEQTANSFTQFDYDGDLIADISIRRPSNGYQYIKRSSDGAQYRIYFGSMSTDVPISGDFDGDGIADLAIYRSTSGHWIIRRSSDGVNFGLAFGTTPGDVPVPADYDGDGITDLAIYRNALNQGQWIIRPSSNPSSFQSVTFGNRSDDIPIPADYDGDGITDIAIRRPSLGQWLIRSSASDNQIVRYTYGFEYDDIPTPGDYDGDGITDLSIKRPRLGVWYVRYSSNNQFYSTFFGALDSDIPVQADYDGDGKTDFAFRRSGQLIYRSSSNGYNYSTGFGMRGDIAHPAPILDRMSVTQLSSNRIKNFNSDMPTIVYDETVVDVGDHVELIPMNDTEIEAIFKSEILN